ncbi:MAG: nucleoside triphosphate pyrophosphatase [Xanthomonadales bacterium]|jgi:septum formation protein|nr:nucleoside triphosphate pyrophosphatase [Xanthomonadales bacterium]
MFVEPIFSGIILASQSPARAELLRRLRLPFTQVPAHIDETPESGEAPRDLAARLAREKARAIAREHPDALVIGSDQVSVFGGKPLGKPGSLERGRRQLGRFSGNDVLFHTAVTVTVSGSGFEESFIDTTEVRFRELGEDEIDRYLQADDPLQCAGSFKVESLGPALFEWVRSEDPTALTGLPLIRLTHLLRQAGCALP